MKIFLFRKTGWLFVIMLAALLAVPAPASPVQAAAPASPVQAAAPGPFAQVTTGLYHTCVLRSGGSVACFGDNSYGQAPSMHPGLFIQISAGDYHTCGLKSDGSAECWGRNDHGQAPEYAPGPYTQIAAGGAHSCGLKTDGSVECAGDNTYGQAPATRPGPYRQITTGLAHTCGLKTDGNVECWGWNAYGQAPAFRQGPFSLVTAGWAHTCAKISSINMNGALDCWGNNSYNQLAWGGLPYPYTQLSSRANFTCGLGYYFIHCFGQNNFGQLLESHGDDNYRQISVGGYHACAIKSDGTLTCWGDNSNGQAPANGNSRFIQVSAGEDFTCWLKLDGTLECWGEDNVFDQYISGKATPPAGVYTLVNAGSYHACALREDGTMICWGDDTWQQSSWVVLYNSNVKYKQIGAGRMHTCGIRSDNKLVCWSTYTYDGLVSPPGGSYKQVGGGGRHACALKWDLSAQCWGSNKDDTNYFDIGVAEDKAGPFTQLAVGYMHNCAIRTDGTVFCWGGNLHSQSNAPSGTFTQISAGRWHTCAIRTNGTLACWGYNLHGQRNAPSGIYSSLDAGSDHNCAILRNGQWQCWGSNSDGQAPQNPAVPPAPEGPDTTGPLVRIVLTPTQADGANGWYRGPVTVDTQARDQDSQVGDVRCALDPETTPASFDDLPAAPCEFRGGAPVFHDGAHTLYAAAEDVYGNQSAVVSTSFQIDATAPVITCPQVGPFILNSGDQAIGPAGVDASISGLDEAASTLGGIVTTESVGLKSLTFTAFDLAGNSASQECSYNVIYDFGGFYPPVEPAPVLNSAKAGSTIPLKFSLAGDQGLEILAAGFPAVQPVSCQTGEPLGDPTPATSTGGSGLSFDPLTGWYNFVWKTDKAWTGSCQALILQFIDGTQHLAYFLFQ